jgi:predicted dinucleotide-binding enzyme
VGARRVNIAVLGTGMVGRTIGSTLVSLGHEVGMGSRTAENPTATAWAAESARPSRLDRLQLILRDP